MKLDRRGYEESAVAALGPQLLFDRRVVAVAPAGAGKTVMGSMLLEAMSASKGKRKRWRRVLWLAHRTELIAQARAHLVNLGVRCGVLCAKYEALHPEHVDRDAYCQVGSIQTVHRRKTLLDDIDLIVVDEAHRVMADTYQAIARAYPLAEVLGFTATPCRLDGRGLGDFFQAMNILVQPSQLYKEGYLREPVTYIEDEEEVLRGLRGAKTVGGDYTRASMRKAVNKPRLIGNIVQQALRLAPKVPKVVYAATVQHSKRIVARFRKEGIAAAHLDGTTNAEERARLLEALRVGTIEVICNVDVLTEGWDLPTLGAVIIARPTKSLGRLMQMIGRVQRPEGSRRKLVIDHASNCTRLQHIPGEDVAWTLERGEPEQSKEPRLKTCVECDALIPWACTECPACGAEVPMTKTSRQILDEQEAELVRLNRRRFEKKRNELRKRAAKIARKRGLDMPWVERVVDGEMPRV